MFLDVFLLLRMCFHRNNKRKYSLYKVLFKDIFVENMNSQSVEIMTVPQPESLSATIGELDGEIDLQWDAVKGASGYVIELSKNKNGNWEQIDIVSSSKYTVAMLKTKITYNFRIAALIGKRQGPWSEMVSKKL